MLAVEGGHKDPHADAHHRQPFVRRGRLLMVALIMLTNNYKIRCSPFSPGDDFLLQFGGEADKISGETRYPHHQVAVCLRILLGAA